MPRWLINVNVNVGPTRSWENGAEARPLGMVVAADPSLLLPLPRVIAVRGKSHVFQLLDYEVSIMPGVSGVNARKLARLCGYHGESPLCAVSNRALPRRAPSWTPDARDRGLESWGVHMARGGAGLLPALARVCAERSANVRADAIVFNSALIAYALSANARNRPPLWNTSSRSPTIWTAHRPSGPRHPDAAHVQHGTWIPIIIRLTTCTCCEARIRAGRM